MSKRNRSQARGRGAAARREKREQALPWSVRLRSMSDLLLHPSSPDERPWKFLLPVLALAFVARAAIALSGDFVLHPDEIMQYLEPAHRLVFGNGVTYWEYFYGARSWLVPGLVAGVLKLFDIVGLGQPAWYVGGIKFAFCAISLLIPAGMYFFARCHFGETAARVALLMGAFWYELAGFAHKPMTEFVATALLVSLLALCVRPAPDKLRVVLTVAVLAVLMAAIRVQYAPLALLVLGLFFLRTEKRTQLVLAAAMVFVAVGVFDAITWDGGLFHSYIVNIRVNLALDDFRAGESPAWQFLYWLLIANMGLVALCVLAVLHDLRRYGLLLALIALTLLIHSTQSHKEYRFIFVVIPLWLLIGADFVVWFASRASENRSRPSLGPTSLALTASFAAVSLAGILNALPYQDRVYQAYSKETGVVGFLRNQDPIFAAYRYLASAPGVSAVWQVDRPYFNLPGYYYLHHAIPFYDANTGRLIFADQEKTEVEAIAASVSHIVSADPATSVPGYSVEKTFGTIRILCRDADELAIRPWQEHTPTITGGTFAKLMNKLYPDAPTPPPNAGIRFADESTREGEQ
ncbi:MAG: hypothetical protein OXN90_14525 [Gemmatimonadota bacterium]|nr:hypothetical protein [Gemmatimonadota bacterium]